MEPISHLIKVSIPNYLSGLPIPNSIGGWFRLGVRDWISLIPPTALLAGIGYMSYQAYCPHARPNFQRTPPLAASSDKQSNAFSKPPKAIVNPRVKKDEKKVVDFVDVEDITEKTVFCRCWRSENWPYCDGAHGAHNQATCDNVGPLVITKKSE